MFQKYKILQSLVLVGYAFFYSSSFAQELKGRVIDSETGDPVPFATVYVAELSTGCMADSLGWFSLDRFPSGTVTLKVSAIGYSPLNMPYRFNPSENLEILLDPVHIHLDEIVVSTPFGRLQNENVTNVESHRLSDLNRIPALSLSEAVASIPGVYQTTQGNGISKPVIRGMSGTRVVTYLNGLRIENQQWGDDHGMGVTSVGVDAVEVIKGPASLLYGSDALGGVLYFVNQPYAAFNRFEGYYQTRFETNTLGTTNEVGLKWNRKGLKFNVFAGQTFQGDYQLANGFRVKDSRFSSETAKFSVGYNKGKWVGNLHYTYLHNTIGIPGHSHEDSLYTALFYSSKPAWVKTLPFQSISNQYLSLENKFYFTHSSLELNLGQTVNHLQEFEEKFTIAGLDMLLNNSLYNIRWKRKLNQYAELVTGSQGMFQVNRNNPSAEEVLIPDNTSADAGVYALLQLAFKKISFQGGLRYDARQIKTQEAFNGFPALDRIYTSYNYSGGFVYHTDSLVLRLNFSSGFRAPHTSEMLANGVHHGTFRYTIGDPNLTNESANQLDFSAGVNYDHLEILVNPFFSVINNYIYQSPSDSIIDGYQVYFYKQAAQARLFGGDFSIHLHPHFAHWLHFQSSFSYLYAEDNAGNPLPYIPQNRINSQVKFEFESERKVRISDVVLQYSYYFSQNRVAGFETTTPAYHLLHAGINLKCSTKNQPLVISLGLKNALNTDYTDHLSRLKQIGLANPGINFYLSLKYDFGIKLTNH